LFPIRDSIRPRRTPVVTYLLVALNLVGFALEVQAADIQVFVERFAVVPARLLAAVPAGQPFPELGTVGSAMFLHGDILHLLGNLWFLWIFGDNVEDRLGRGRFLAFYLLCGVVATAAHIASDPASQVPVLGASGAIAGVLGAYLRLFPGARVLAVVPIFVFLHFVEVRAVFFLGLWFVFQLASSVWGGDAGVAWWAHVAGFAAGLVLSLLVPVSSGPKRKSAPRRPRR
jgi:membrane associated rhomboid family serine protease